MLKEWCNKEHGLRVQEIDEEGATNAVNAGRHCVKTFWKVSEWGKFRKLRRAQKRSMPPDSWFLIEFQVVGDTIAFEYAAVLREYDTESLHFWNDAGNFKRADWPELGEMGFFDIFWYETDLTEGERAAWGPDKELAAKETRATEERLLMSLYTYCKLPSNCTCLHCC
ncbi:hypothetical protein ACA910_006846 [Epithemia clementina (nom. ined.)]